jgi:hypothetical protein
MAWGEALMELAISEVPERQGKWLVVVEESSYYPVAKFRTEAAEVRFKEWARQSNGKIFFFEEQA